MRQAKGPAGRSTGPSPAALAAALLGAALLWAYWPTLRVMAARWSTDPRYAHGYLVPLFAGFLLWHRRDRCPGLASRPSWGGLALIAAGIATWLAGAYYSVDWLEAASLMPTLAGLCVLAAGWRSLVWAWSAIAFLVFMMPLPYRLEVALAHPLQRIATRASAYALQTMGFPALAEGNVIHLEEHEIGVVEACSGLSMLVTFVAIATGVAMVIRRPWPDRLLVVASSVPIAVLANVARVAVTGMMHETVGSYWANLVFHDLAGWLMMPAALGLLLVELELLSRLFVEPSPAPEALGPLGAAGVAKDAGSGLAAAAAPAPAPRRGRGGGGSRAVEADPQAAALRRLLKGQ